MRGFVVLLLGIAACGEDEPTPPRPSECTRAQELTGGVVSDFCLYDANSTSPTADEAVSPRHYLESISGWYFATAT